MQVSAIINEFVLDEMNRRDEQFEEEAKGFWNLFPHEGYFSVFCAIYLHERWQDFVIRN